MKSKRFGINLFLRVILLTITMILFAYYFGRDERIFTVLLLGFLTILQVYLLYRYVSRINRELARFLILIKEGDISTHYPEKIETTFKGLKNSFRKINEDFKNERWQKEQRQQYLEIIINHTDTGIISYDENGKIDIANRAATRLLSNSNIYSLSDLDKIKPGFMEFIKRLPPGEPRPYKVFVDGSLKIFLFQATFVNMEGEVYSILSFQDIKAQLDIKELDSFKKLVRVIAHEIMNSLTPITTLTRSIRNNIQDADFVDKEAGKEITNDITESIDLIDDRALGLSNFVDKYRKLTQLPRPQLKSLELAELLHDTELLFKENLEKQNIDFSISIPEENIKVNADEGMLKQVLINLIKNAMEAVQGSHEPKIEVAAAKTANKNVEISIKDNGCGISNEDQEKIFQPFYTTKESGSGIGLSLSLQIIQLHGGKLTMNSTPSKGSVFCIII